MKLPRTYHSLEALQAALVARARAGSVLHVTIEHGPCCSPRCCRCQPTYRLEQLTEGAMLAGVEAERRWQRESLS